MKDVLQGLTPRRLMMASIVVALATIVLKTLAWWLTGSVGMLSDAMESVVNLAGATFGLWMVTVAAMPADTGHPFGHDKAEYFSSGFEGILIMVAAAAIIWAALPRFWHPQPLEQIGWGLALSVLSSVLNAVLALVMLQASRRHRSMALEGDARHLLADVWTSVGVVLGVLLVAITGWLWLDPLIGVGVALHIAWEGGRLVWRSSQGLMDEAIEPEERARIDAALRDFRRHSGDRSAVQFDHLITRRAGQRRFVNLHMHMPPRWTLHRAAALRQQIERDLLEAVPGLYVSIEMLPDGVEPVFVSPSDVPVDGDIEAALEERSHTAAEDKGGEDHAGIDSTRE